jgi:hypothetical protein
LAHTTVREQITSMGVRRVIRKRFRTRRDGVDVAADVNATIAANVGRGSQRVRVSSRQEPTGSKREEGTPDAEPDDRNHARSDPEDDSRR